MDYVVSNIWDISKKKKKNRSVKLKEFLFCEIDILFYTNRTRFAINHFGFFDKLKSSKSVEIITLSRESLVGKEKKSQVLTNKGIVTRDEVRVILESNRIREERWDIKEIT